jgi:hypothetical protein
MNLPNYFLADLPPEASLNPGMISEACLTLKRNRQSYLLARSTSSLASVLDGVAQQWLHHGYPFRKLALEQASSLGFSHQTLATGMDSFFRRLTAESLHDLLLQDLGHSQRLDALCATDLERRSSRAGLALGPELLLHVTPGKLPHPALLNMALGFLMRSAQFVTCSSGTSLLPRLFAHSIYEIEPKMAACLEIAELRGDVSASEQVLFEAADCVVARGSEESLASLRNRLPVRTRFLGQANRVSFCYLAAGALSVLTLRKVASRAASDVVAWNQLGVFAPHVIYVERGGAVTPEQFAEALAEELDRREESEPRGDAAPEIAAAIASRRSVYESRAAHSRVTESPDYPQTRLVCSSGSTAWTVVFENDPRFQTSCLNRFVYVKEVHNLAAALQGADAIKAKVSTVGVAVPEDQLQEVAMELARWGAKRVCPLGQMQNPPLASRSDGRPALGDLVTWMDYEMQ